MLKYLILVASVHQVSSASDAGDALLPNPALVTTQFNTTANFRQNFCDLQDLYDSSQRSIELRKVLQGKSLNVVIGNSTDFMNFKPDGSIDERDPGLFVTLLDELARRGEFSWRDTFVLVDPPPPDKTYTDLLLWQTETYDLTVDWYLATTMRQALGVSFPRGFYDASIIIIGTVDESANRSKFSLFSWCQPFTIGVWLSLLGTLLVSAFVAILLEENNTRQSMFNRNSFRSKFNSWSITSNLYKSFMAFTGHLDMQPNTRPGAIVSLSLSFFAVLMLSAYTANLASFLVIENSTTRAEIEEIADIVANGMSMCVIKDGAKHEILKDFYPNAKFVTSTTEEAVYLDLGNGMCDYAISGVSAWREFERKQSANAGCKLIRVGRIFKNQDAGFATASDAGIKSTSLVRDIMNILFLEMYDDGFVEDSWDDHLRKTSDLENVQCLEEDTSNENVGTLDMTNLGGIFVFHFMFMGIALILVLLGKSSTALSTRSIRKLDASEDDDDDDDDQSITKLDASDDDEGQDVSNAADVRFMSTRRTYSSRHDGESISMGNIKSFKAQDMAFSNEDVAKIKMILEKISLKSFKKIEEE